LRVAVTSAGWIRYRPWRAEDTGSSLTTGRGYVMFCQKD
jgi:hypothetical protein